jgi:hypothetical protein
MASTSYTGSYRLTGVYESGNKINIPDGDFLFKMEETEDPNTFSFGIKIGNSLGSSFTVVPGTHKISVGMVRSTMMMPPPEIFALEQTLSKILPVVDTISLCDESLILEGDEAKLEFAGKTTSTS